MTEENAKLIMGEISKRFEKINDLKELNDYKVEQLGKKGKITEPFPFRLVLKVSILLGRGIL